MELSIEGRGGEKDVKPVERHKKKTAGRGEKDTMKITIKT